MMLIDDWRRVMRKAWSLRLALMAAVLSALEVGVQLLAPDYPGPWFACGSALLCLAATLARIVAQPRMRADE
jgi:hypothetical protein